MNVRTLLFLDPPDHTRLRRLVSKAFTPRRIEQLREHVREITDELLADVEPGEPFDVISTLGVPAAGHRHLRADGRTCRGPPSVRRVVVRRHAPARRRHRRRHDAARDRRRDVLHQLLQHAVRSAPRRAARRPREWAARRRGVRRRVERGGAAQHRAAAVPRRPRDDDEPDRQRTVRAHAASRPVGPAGRRSFAGWRRRSRSCCATTDPYT